jgi:uncharacterized membrane protein HdeD (DUF308 family)
MAQAVMRVLGVVLTVAGLAGFFLPLPGLLDLTLTHNLVHLVSGLAALYVSRDAKSSVWLAKLFGFIYLLLGVAGFFIQDVAGLVHLTLTDSVIHLALALVTLWLGFRSADEA